MGCNTSQELKTKKPEDDSAEGGNPTTIANEQTTAAVNGEASADGTHSTPSVEDSSANKSVVPSSDAATNNKTAASHQSEPNSKNNTKQQQQLQQKSSITAGDAATPNGLVNGDIKDVKRCGRAEITELNDVDIDGDDDDDEDDSEDEAKAATKIQAAFRGHKVRATMKKSADTSAVAAATTNKNPPPAEAVGKSKTAEVAVAENIDPTKEELEAEFDPNDKELCDAALKIQATFRGHLSRKLVGNKTAEDLDIQEITKKVAEELDIDLTDPELNKAATKIQASFRGHKSRKEAN